MSFIQRIAHQTKSNWLPIAVGSAAVAASAAYTYSAYNVSGVISNDSVASTFTGNGEWINLKLQKFEDLSADSRLFYFELPENQKSGLVTASLVLAKYVTPKGSNVIRPYTPVSDPDQRGVIEFVIKKYPEGKFGKHIFSLKPNDTVAFKGPIVKWQWKANQFKDVTLIGGGSGITPLYQILHQVTKDKDDQTKVNLIYGSKTYDDILLRQQIEELAAKYPEQVKVSFFLDEKSDKLASANVGYITADWLKKNIAAPGASHQVFVCGPPPLYKAISGPKVSPSDQGEVEGALKELGFTKENVFKF
ncbi:hypothetical protein WICPIJ_001498 [Wickerhamomyces pijperi]|uniref:NADH-cytochrome b5 reductase n=1 Tax=Wickerhamomyces pijperi TaxID=599730 RepID=A0A9P8QBL3_WICPI|nr:hypothetical protein WICPIJ_001498 [Wickerhamomyces pijperi]